MRNLDQVWTEEDFDRMTWHDNHVHGITIREGPHGAGELVLDLDYILDWRCDPGGEARFRIAPALLRFREVTALRISLDYETPSAALGPFSIDRVERTTVLRERYEAQVWRIGLSWPEGEIHFESSGFEQRLSGRSHVKDQQSLTHMERAGERLDAADARDG